MNTLWKEPDGQESTETTVASRDEDIAIRHGDVEVLQN